MRRKHIVATGLAVCAAVYWGYILASGGVVRRAERKLDRPALGVPVAALGNGEARDVGAKSAARVARGASTGSTVQRPSDPRARLDELEQRLAQLEAPLAAGRFAGLDPLACAWSLRASTSPGTDARAAGDVEFGAWCASHALGGTHVHGSLRIAMLGGRVVREGDTLEGARVARIDPGSIEIEWKGSLRELQVTPASSAASADEARDGGVR